MRILSDHHVTKAISMKEAIEVVENAYIQLHNKEANVPLRSTLVTPHGVCEIIIPLIFYSQLYLCLHN